MCLAVPGRVLRTWDDDGMAMATVETDGVRVDASLALVDDVEVGEWVLVHVGFAIARVDEDIAAASLDALRRVGARRVATSPEAEVGP